MMERRWLVAAVVACAVGAAGYLVGAGPLDPPGGPVAPTYKTLDEVRPGVPITADQVPLTISLRGTYYLAENLYAVGFDEPVIRISSSDVTLDLCGFAIIGSTEVSQAASGIEIVEPAGNIVVRDGTIRACVGPGIKTVGNGGNGYLLERLRVVANEGNGIQLPFNGGTALDCFVRDNGGGGIGIGRIVARNCLVSNNGGPGIVAFEGVIQSCTVRGNVGGNIALGAGVNVDNDAP